MPKRDLNDVIRGRLGLDKVVQRFEEGGFDIIAGRSGPSIPIGTAQPAAWHSARPVAGSGGGLRCRYHRLGRGCRPHGAHDVRVGPPANPAGDYGRTDLADRCLCVYQARQSPRACRKTSASSLTRRRASPRAKKPTATLLKACENFLRLSPPNGRHGPAHDPKVKDSIRHQTPILTRSPNSDAACDVEKIAQLVVRQTSRGEQKNRGELITAPSPLWGEGAV